MTPSGPLSQRHHRELKTGGQFPKTSGLCQMCPGMTLLT